MTLVAISPHDVEIHFVDENGKFATAQMGDRMAFLDHVMRSSPYPLVDVAASFARKCDYASVDYFERAEFLFSFLNPEACAIVMDTPPDSEKFYALIMRRDCAKMMLCDEEQFKIIREIVNTIDEQSCNGKIGYLLPEPLCTPIA